MTATNKFNFGNNVKPHELSMYLDNFICVNQNGNSVYGVLERIDKKEGYVYFNPSLVGNANGSLAIVKRLPTKVDFPLTIIRPMIGTLEDFVESYNKTLKEKKESNKQSEK